MIAVSRYHDWKVPTWKQDDVYAPPTTAAPAVAVAPVSTVIAAAAVEVGAVRTRIEGHMAVIVAG